MRHYDLELKTGDTIQLKRNLNVQDYWDEDNLFPIHRFKKGAYGTVTEVIANDGVKYYTISLGDKEIGIQANVSSKFLVK